MENPFTRNEEDIYQPLCIALMLTKRTERILVGRPDYVQCRLAGIKNVPVYCDCERRIGTFLVAFEEDEENSWWAKAGGLLYEALDPDLTKKFLLSRNAEEKEKRKELEEAARTFLVEKYQTGDPVCQFTALRMWFGYLRARARIDGETKCSADFRKSVAADYADDVEHLIYPFSKKREELLDEGSRVLPNDPIFRWPRCKTAADLEARKVYPTDKIKKEYVYVTRSFLALKAYYTEWIQQRKQFLIRCGCCGKYFLGDNRHITLCSSACKKIQTETNLEYRKKDKLTAEVDRLCRNGYQHWFNRIKKAEGIVGFPEERLACLKREMKEFQKEKTLQRKRYKAGEIDFKQLGKWMLEQEKRAEILMGEYEFRCK